ncbi:MAG TPA: hypothetical protein VFE61_10265 [Candidatus Sulfotelmatobacter sp.]|nr:hypothetical protein [Candidatus Sulfotelmatobacter sp.]
MPVVRPGFRVKTGDLAIQINPNAEQLRPEEPHRPRIPGTARQFARQPALALTRVIVGEQMGSASVPAIP